MFLRKKILFSADSHSYPLEEGGLGVRGEGNLEGGVRIESGSSRHVSGLRWPLARLVPVYVVV